MAPKRKPNLPQGGVRQHVVALVASSKRESQVNDEHPRKRSKTIATPGSSSASKNPKPSSDLQTSEIAGSDKAHAENYKSCLKQHFALNKSSAKDLQTLGELSMKAGAKGSEGFARAGGEGVREGNTHRDMKRYVARDSSMPKEYYADIRVYDPEQGF